MGKHLNHFLTDDLVIESAQDKAVKGCEGQKLSGQVL